MKLLPYRRQIVVTALAMLAGAFLIIASDSSGAKPAIVIKMIDMPPVFQPVQTNIKVGETVEWENVGNEVHHATSDPALAIKRSEVANPPGAEPFDSGFLKPGESFSHTFSVPGVYRYACVVHESKGMTGEIVVQK